MALTSFGNAAGRRGAQNSTITQNFFSGDGTEDLFFSSTQAAGTISTNTAFNNSFGSTKAATYSGTETINASTNWWGINTEAGVTAKIGGTGVTHVDRTPFLDVGTDTDLVTPGFQGSFALLHVTATGTSRAAPAASREPDLVTASGTVFVHKEHISKRRSRSPKR